MQDWESFFVAEAGAAAVLAGLIFVGISINLKHILSKQLVSRAAWVSLLTLMEVLVITSLMLIPAQPLLALGTEVVVIGLLCWIIISATTFTQLRPQAGFVEGQTWYGKLSIIFLSQLITLPFVISGIILLLGNESGVYWMVPGILAALPYSLYMGWVLTVEVNR